jgi:putative membrane protein
MFKLFDSLYKIKVTTIYLLLGFGGLWNFLGFFQSVMSTFAGIMIMIIAHYILYEILSKKITPTDNILSKSSDKYKTNIFYFFIFIVVASWFLEFAGVKTGYIFGRYSYSNILIPQIFGVPLAIGFAWFSTLIASLGVIQMLTKINLRLISVTKKSLLVGFLMTIFDYSLEIAATKLGYWSWQIGIVPVQNYLAWFVFGSLFAFIGYKFQVLDNRLPKITAHLYLAQMLFFIVSSF